MFLSSSPAIPSRSSNIVGSASVVPLARASRTGPSTPPREVDARLTSTVEFDRAYFRSHHSGPREDDFEEIVLPPAPVALTSSPGRRARELTDSDTSSRGRPLSVQRNLTQKFYDSYKTNPVASRAQVTPHQSPQRSPERSSPQSLSKISTEFMPTLTGDKSGEIRIEAKTGKLQSWFKGSSTPVNLGMPVEECVVVNATRFGSPVRPVAKLQKKPTTSVVHIPPPSTSTSRFTFFGSNSKASIEKPPVQPPADDDLYSLDIHTALFPNGPPDPFSPAAFKNLQANAEGLLSRLQMGYKMRTMELEQVSADMSAQEEELEEAETRARHLKIQLADMAAKVQEQEQAMKEMAEELAIERKRRMEEEEARQRSIALVRRPKFTPMVEDEVPAKDRNKRESITTVASDSGFESECESSAGSIFSVARASTVSPSGTMFSSATGATSPDIEQQARFAQSPTSSPYVRSNTLRGRSTQAPVAQPTSTFQRVLKGMTSAPPVAGEPQQAWSCANCSGGDSNSAWRIVSSLRDENRDLRERTAHLEHSVEGCLDLINGLMR